MPVPRGWTYRTLDAVEHIGSKLPDPDTLFLLLLLAVWAASWLMPGMSFTELDPRSGKPIAIIDMLDGASLTTSMAEMVRTFVNFPPVGVVLVAMLGLGANFPNPVP